MTTFTTCPNADAAPQRLDTLAKINAVHLKNIIAKNDDAALEVASNIGRYISDIEIVGLIRAAASGNKDLLHTFMSSITDRAIQRVSEVKAIRQMDKYGSTANDVVALLEEVPMSVKSISDRLALSEDRVREILAEISAVTVAWDAGNEGLVRVYGLAELEARRVA